MKKFLVLFFLCGVAQAAAFKAMDSFDAGYSINVSWAKFDAADALVTWRNFGDRYEIVSEMHTVGAAAAIRKLQLIQKSVGRITPKGLAPEMFTTERDGKLVEKVIFDWNNLVAHFDVQGSKREFKINDDAQDILTLPYQLGYWRSNEESWPRNVLVITGKRVNEYTINQLADETVKTKLGPFETHHFHCTVAEKEEFIDLWIMKNVHHTVSIYFNNPGKVNIRYDLRTAPTFISTATPSLNPSPQASPEANDTTPAKLEH